MKTLTIKQPYATLIQQGIKEYEFRTWKTNYRGEILIHAGKGIDKEKMIKFQNYNLEYPSACIIAKAILTDCIKVDEKFRKTLKSINALVYENIINNKEWEGYAFKLENIEIISPITVKGKLSFWEYDYNKIEVNQNGKN